jgi:hypothetical protein
MASPQTLQERALDQACQTVLFMALELSDKKWKLALSDGNQRRIVTITAGDLVTLGEAVAKAKARFGMPGGVSIVSCYEAGRDGFWLHRYLVHCGIANVVVDASSIEVNRRARRAKTDRVDVEQLLRLLIRYHHGEKRVWSVVHVPSVEEEDARRLHRELERLKKERTGHRNRIQALLESLWKQNLYKTMLWFIYLAKLRTDLLDNRSLAILLETYKLLICYTLVFGQPLSSTLSIYRNLRHN